MIALLFQLGKISSSIQTEAGCESYVLDAVRMPATKTPNNQVGCYLIARDSSYGEPSNSIYSFTCRYRAEARVPEGDEDPRRNDVQNSTPCRISISAIKFDRELPKVVSCFIVIVNRECKYVTSCFRRTNWPLVQADDDEIEKLALKLATEANFSNLLLVKRQEDVLARRALSMITEAHTKLLEALSRSGLSTSFVLETQKLLNSEQERAMAKHTMEYGSLLRFADKDDRFWIERKSVLDLAVVFTYDLLSNVPNAEQSVMISTIKDVRETLGLILKNFKERAIQVKNLPTS